MMVDGSGTGPIVPAGGPIVSAAGYYHVQAAPATPLGHMVGAAVQRQHVQAQAVSGHPRHLSGGGYTYGLPGAAPMVPVPGVVSHQGREAPLAAAAAPAAPEATAAKRDEADSDLDWVAWTPNDVGKWVDGLLGPGRGEPFRRHEVDGPTLLGLTDSELREPLGFADPLQRAKLLGHLRAFQVRRVRLARKAARQRGGQEGVPGQQVHDENHLSTGQRRKVHASPPPRHLSRSQSMASSISSGHSTSRFSRYLGPNNCSTGNLNSCFGFDSPSNSVKGSFSMATRKTFTGARPADLDGGPGPAAYNVIDAERNSAKAQSPSRVTIGNAPRRPESDPTHLENRSPGPLHYAPDSISLRPTSPRATMGRSLRDTMANFVTPDARLAMGSEGNRCSSPRAPSPRVKGGVIPSASRMIGTPQRGVTREPGPCSYKVNDAERSNAPRATIGNAARNTSQFLVKEREGPGPGPGRDVGSPLPRARARGGVIGSSPRFRATSGSPSARSPGPASYSPRPTILSTFR